ncbi:type IV toxin-antitoxin system AbiEi family antitoxin, partial [bacterium]|nr:type IV toxin-antitoxin system AbiEi family antitoxin [bacterium]
MLGSITKIFITSLLLIISWSSIGQSLHLYVDNKPLNKVLLELRDAHGVQFSFNDKLIEECLISD